MIALTQEVEVVVIEAVVTLAEVTATGVEEEGFSRPIRCHDGQGGPVNTVFLPLFFLQQLKTYKVRFNTVDDRKNMMQLSPSSRARLSIKVHLSRVFFLGKDGVCLAW